RVTAPGSGGCVGIAGSTSVQQTDHTELSRFSERRLPRDVRVGVVFRPLHGITLVGRFGGRITHRAFFTLGSGTGATFFVVGLLLDDLGLFLLLLALGSRLEVLLN